MARQISVTARWVTGGVRITCVDVPSIKDRFVPVSNPDDEMDIHEAVKAVIRSHVPPRDWPECSLRVGHIRDKAFLFHTLSNLNPP